MSKRVLVVDDDPEWRAVIAGVLEPECSIVGYVANAYDLAASAVNVRPDIVTLDICMPGKSGLKALPEVRQLFPEAVIVIVTCSTNPLYREEAFRRGADAYVLKNRISTELATSIAACA
jgi:DNA-binding NarL/FixJ family response regulator